MADENDPRNQMGDPDLNTESGDSPGSTIRRWVVVHHTTLWQPPTDVYELDDRLIVLIEIAGMRDSDFSVVLQGQQLTISGMRERVTETESAYHQLEIRFGEFRTEIGLPVPVQRDDVVASYRDGFLRVELPRTRKRKVQIVNVDEMHQDAGSDEHPEATES